MLGSIKGRLGINTEVIVDYEFESGHDGGPHEPPMADNVQVFSVRLNGRDISGDISDSDFADLELQVYESFGGLTDEDYEPDDDRHPF